MFGLGSAKKKPRSHHQRGEKVHKFFTIHVHSLKPWPSNDDRGKTLELVWKADKVR